MVVENDSWITRIRAAHHSVPRGSAGFTGRAEVGNG